ncbi:unnamed protein product [Sphagnum jensenii]
MSMRTMSLMVLPGLLHRQEELGVFNKRGLLMRWLSAAAVAGSPCTPETVLADATAMEATAEVLAVFSQKTLKQKKNTDARKGEL